MEPRHERIARVALAAGAKYGLALAGGYAVSAHGMGNRPSGDVDLFTSWQRRGEFPELIAAVVAALEAAGYKVSVILSAETFTRLALASPEGRALPRDFLDVDAAITSGRYTREQLLELAAEADHGFDRLLFADALGALTQITDAAFAEYRAAPGMISELRHRFTQWRRELLAAPS
jgi:hypothetical protein